MIFCRFAFMGTAVFSTFSGPCVGRVFGGNVSRRQAASETQSLSTQLQNICDRRYSATSVVGNKLFVNAGQDLRNRSRSTLDYLDFDDIQYIDLSSSWRIGSPPLRTLSKPTDLTSINEGCGWSDGTNFYQYGGWQITENIQEDFKVWQYESSSNAWTAISADSFNVERLASGGCTNAPGIKKSYAFGGFIDQATTNNPWYYRQGKLEILASRADLVEFDWETKTAKNITYTNNTKRRLNTADNALAYIPVGKSGILVSFGGRDSGFQQMSNLAEVKFYDIASSSWHYQVAEGAVQPDVVPAARVEPCIVVQPAADHSSYNIYMFGGSWADNEASTYNDMWILSLPSFKWFRVDYLSPTSWEVAGGRTSHTCQIIGNRQMVIIGGGRSAEAHVQCKYTPLFIFDMSTLFWKAGFDSTLTAYTLPVLITDVIGGHGWGGANLTLNRPTFWNDAHTTEVFTFGSSVTSDSDAAATSLATRVGAPIPTIPTIPTGAIVGGVVGSILALVALGTAVIVCRGRRTHGGGIPLELGIQELSSESALHELQGPIYELHAGTAGGSLDAKGK